MKVTVAPQPLSGTLAGIPSKSAAHRLLLGAALSRGPSRLCAPVFSQDIAATVRCLSALCAQIEPDGTGCAITPVQRPDRCILDCGESGSTYRFLAPVACALGKRASFALSGKLPQRPMDALWDVLQAHGARIRGRGTACVEAAGPISAGTYRLAGNISSQFFTGLLYALPLLPQDSRLMIDGPLQSKGYLDMTLQTLRAFHIHIRPEESGFFIPGGQEYRPPERLIPEGDWSNAAFWLCAGAVGGSGITITGLKPDSAQADRSVCQLLRRFGAQVEQEGDRVHVAPGVPQAIEVDGADIPDLIPALAIVAAGAEGDTVFRHVSRLRLKESDRVAAICQTLRALGGSAEAGEDALIVHGTGSLRGGAADAWGDHRIAMLAAAASVLCHEPVTITGAQAVAKSYPQFFEHLAALGGSVWKEDAP